MAELEERARWMLVVVALALGAAGAALLLLDSDRDARGAAESRTGKGDIEHAEATEVDAPALVHNEEREAVAPAEPAASSAPDEEALAIEVRTAALTVLVRCGEGGSPAEGMFVSVRSEAEIAAKERYATRRTEPDGRARFESLAPGAYAVFVQGEERTAKEDVELVSGEVRELELLVGLQHASGRVLDVRGAGIPGARIWVDGELHASTDEQGRYELGCLIRPHWLGATAPGFGPSNPVLTRDLDGEHDFVLWPECGAVEGRVVDAYGLPLEDARVDVSFVGLGGMGAIQLAYSPAGNWRTGERSAIDGSFRLEDTPLGFVVVRGRLAGYADGQQDVRVQEPGEPVYVEIVLRRGATVRGVVTGEDDTPLSGVTVSRSTVDRSGVWGPRIRVSTESGADGTFELLAIPQGVWELAAESDAGRAVETVNVRDLEEREWNPVLGGGVIRGRVVRESGEPAAGLLAILSLPGNDHVWRSFCETDTNGEFLLKKGAPGGNRVGVLRAIGDIRTLAEAEDVVPGGEPLLLTVPDALWPSAWIVGHVVAWNGEPAEEVSVVAFPLPVEGPASVCAASADGSFRCGPYAPGAYKIRIASPETFYLEMERELMPDGTLDLGLLTLERGCYVRFRFVNPQNESYLGNLSVQAIPLDGGSSPHEQASNGEARLGPLREGRHTVTVRTWDPVTRGLAIQEQELVIDVRCEPDQVEVVTIE